jgi:hypothetical protein
LLPIQKTPAARIRSVASTNAPRRKALDVPDIV